MDINEEQVLEQIRASLQEQAELEGIELDEEQLDELSKKTLAAYTEKADASHQHHSNSKGAWHAKQAAKRDKGLDRAYSRLVKESIEAMMHAAAEGKPADFGAAFNSALSGVVAEKIDAMRPEVAAGLFTAKE